MEILFEQKIDDILVDAKKFDAENILNILQKALLKHGLDMEEVAVLLNIEDDDLLQKLFEMAGKIKQEIYGNRIVLFAPLYASDYCVNNCRYCAFHADNKSIRTKLTLTEIKEQVCILEAMGHKRLLLELGEDPTNNPIDYVVDAIRTIYDTKNGKGEIRRVNVNIAATTVDNYKKLKDAGIGTYQLFQETYHRPTYEKLHQGPKADYDRQITAHERAYEAGIDDYGMGVLFGLYDYKYEVVSLIAHAKYLENKLGVGPHTISVPRFNQAVTVNLKNGYAVSDKDFLKIIAIIRLAVPYTGMIISTRENSKIRRQAFHIGISQASAGSKTSPGGYGKESVGPEQFSVHDHRSLDEIISDICALDYVPSFCTACYRSSRTGENFMSLAKEFEIHKFCQPNAIATLQEYLIDYASDETRKIGDKLIQKEIDKISNFETKKILIHNLEETKKGKRDLFI
ncbi:MAG: [FeFe] hydrogenase H-cluster radical SAM maturase HydG [Patescibacteria group bacterium]